MLVHHSPLFFARTDYILGWITRVLSGRLGAIQWLARLRAGWMVSSCRLLAHANGYLLVVHHLERVDYGDTEESCIPLIRGEDTLGRPKTQKTAVTGVPILHLLSASHVLASSIIMRLYRKNTPRLRNYLR